MRDRVRELQGQGESREAITRTVSTEFTRTYRDWQNPHWLKNAA